MAYRRAAATVTEQPVQPVPRSRRRARAQDPAVAALARAEADEVIAAYQEVLEALDEALPPLASLRRPRLRGKVEQQQQHVAEALVHLDAARAALEEGDFATCGKAVQEARTELIRLEGPLAVPLTTELAQAVMPRPANEALKANAAARMEAQRAVTAQATPRAAALASVRLYHLVAENLHLAAGVLARQSAAPTATQPKARDGEAVVIPPHELETFDDVGGLDDAKEKLSRIVGALVGGEASGKGTSQNGVLMYGPPGTGKTLLARAVAGEYGLRFMRFSPADIASAYQHEPAKKLRELFALAAKSAPCLLFLDEIDAIAARRETLVSDDKREVVTQLLNCLEDYRACPGLVIMAATNTLDHLDPALREGRFDARIAVPLPGAPARRDILEVRLGDHEEVDWDGIDLDDLARRTDGRSGATLASIVAGAAQAAQSEGAPLSHALLLREIERRSGQDRLHTLSEEIGWDDVVLPEATRRRISEILAVFERPEVARKLGVSAPAGLLLHGPPGTGKTTVAKALANEVKASFYEKSAADLLSKWVGESEQKVAQLFARARQNRPSIIFIDEIDALTKRRATDSVSPWEERVVSQFLRELDGLQGGEGVLLVGATNRLDIIDDAIRDRRLVPIEVPLPDADGRARLLEVLCREVSLAPGVDLAWIAGVTEGMSGADLKSLRDAAGMKAMVRWAEDKSAEASVTEQDFGAALAERGIARPQGSPRRRRAEGGAKPKRPRTK